MIDLVWNFPLLPVQQEIWSRYLRQAVEDCAGASVESQRPSFRTVDSTLRERAARWIGFPAERTWMVCGGHHGTLNALLASGLAGTRFVVEGATYPGFLDQCRMTRTAYDGCAIDDSGLLPAALREMCVQARKEGKRIRGLFTMPTVQNPLGFVTPVERRQEIVAIAREFDLVIIEDDAYGYMEESAPANYAQLAPERTYYVRGLAKSLAPGARTGFLVAPEEATPALVTSLRCTATGTDVPQNLAALRMCEDGTLDRLMQEKRLEGARRNREARTVLGGIAASGASSAWHLWVPLAAGLNPYDVEAAINEADVIVTRGEWCAASSQFNHGLRLALGGEIDRARTLEGVRRVADVLQRTN